MERGIRQCAVAQGDYFVSVVFILFLLGLVIGPITSYFGVGGGFIVVPALYWLYPHISAQVVISTSLGVIFLNCFVNIRNFFRAELKPKWTLAISVGIIMSLGAFLGSLLSSYFSVYVLKFFLACLLFFNAIITFFARKSESPLADTFFKNSSFIMALILIFFAGTLAGITGLGGGIFILPVLFHLLKIPFHKLSLYSNIAMIGSSFVGVTNYILTDSAFASSGSSPLEQFQWGSFNGAIALCIFMGVLVSSPLGVILRKRVRGKQDPYLFSALLLFLSLRLFWTLR